MPIDLSGLTRIGNMTSGSGLNALFDGNEGTTGYAAGTSGYGGVTFGSAQAIDRVQVVSASNGFDASGSSTSITLKLYGKTGSAPASATDGTLLGSIGPFTDVEAVTTHTIFSNDTTSTWDHAWVNFATGVWCIAGEIRFYAPLGAPSVAAAARAVYKKSLDSHFLLPWSPIEIQGFRIDLQVDTDTVALIDFHADVTHRGEFTGFNGVVGVGLKVAYQTAATFANVPGATVNEVPNMIGGFNISERDPHHYGATSLTGVLQLASGFYRFSVRGSSHSTGSGADGLAGILFEPSRGLNVLRVVTDEDAVIVPTLST